LSANSAPDDWIDQALVAGDRSIAGWRARIRTMPAREALKRVPRMGLLQCGIPITPFRAIQAHIRASGLTQAGWVRRAVTETYLREGGEPLVAHEAHAIDRTQAIRDGRGPA
jgi:hypothetical protein